MATNLKFKIEYIDKNIDLLKHDEKVEILEMIHNDDKKVIKETEHGCIVNFAKIKNTTIIETIYSKIKFKIKNNE